VPALFTPWPKTSFSLQYNAVSCSLIMRTNKLINRLSCSTFMWYCFALYDKENLISSCPTIVDKSPKDTYVMYRVICVLQVWKGRCYPLKNALLFPLPTQYNVENHEKFQVLVFKIVCGVGGEVRQVKLYSRLACVQKHPKCKLVHSCRFSSFLWAKPNRAGYRLEKLRTITLSKLFSRLK